LFEFFYRFNNKLTAMAIKVLTNIRFAQTAGISQTLSCFLDYVRKNKKGIIEIVGVNIIDRNKNTYNKTRKDNISIISAGVKIPDLKNVMKKCKDVNDIKKEYVEVINVYRKAINKEKPDIVLVNGTYYMPWCLFQAAREEGLPIVLHYHGILTMETQHWPAKERSLFLAMERSLDHKENFYIFPSKITKTTVEKKIYNHKVKNWTIIPNPVPSYFFDVNREKNNVNNVNIGIISRWNFIKNIEFCETLSKYIRNKNSNFVVNLITDLSKKDKRYKKISKFVKIHPAVKNKELCDFYKKMDIIISPSYFETYGNVAKEALASGVPSLVNKNMGVSETFKKLGLNKWIVEFISVKEVYEKIKQFIGYKIDKKIRKKIKQYYSPEKIFNQLVEILQSQSV